MAPVPPAHVDAGGHAYGHGNSSGRPRSNEDPRTTPGHLGAPNSSYSSGMNGGRPRDSRPTHSSSREREPSSGHFPASGREPPNSHIRSAGRESTLREGAGRYSGPQLAPRPLDAPISRATSSHRHASSDPRLAESARPLPEGSGYIDSRAHDRSGANERPRHIVPNPTTGGHDYGFTSRHRGARERPTSISSSDSSDPGPPSNTYGHPPSHEHTRRALANPPAILAQPSRTHDRHRGHDTGLGGPPSALTLATHTYDNRDGVGHPPRTISAASASSAPASNTYDRQHSRDVGARAASAPIHPPAASSRYDRLTSRNHATERTAQSPPVIPVQPADSLHNSKPSNNIGARRSDHPSSSPTSGSTRDLHSSRETGGRHSTTHAASTNHTYTHQSTYDRDRSGRETTGPSSIPAPPTSSRPTHDERRNSRSAIARSPPSSFVPPPPQLNPPDVPQMRRSSSSTSREAARSSSDSARYAHPVDYHNPRSTISDTRATAGSAHSVERVLGQLGEMDIAGPHSGAAHPYVVCLRYPNAELLTSYS